MFPPSRSCSSCSELTPKHLLCTTSACIAAFATKTFSLLSLCKIQAKTTDQDKSCWVSAVTISLSATFQYVFYSLPACKPLNDNSSVLHLLRVLSSHLAQETSPTLSVLGKEALNKSATRGSPPETKEGRTP